MSRIAFIGGGNMARALIGGAIRAGAAPADLFVGEPSEANRDRLSAEFGVGCSADNTEIVAGADLVVLAVKPQVAASVAKGLAGHLTGSQLVVSIMAGIRCDALRRWLGGSPKIVRAMPNTPALVGFGVTAMFADAKLDLASLKLASGLMAAAGSVVWLDDEKLLDAVTAVSGSGPAYLFLVMEALEDAAVSAGLDPSTARTLAGETLRGAAEMVVRAEVDPAELRRQVTSPGGTTAAALAVLEEAGLRQAFDNAVNAAVERACTLADSFGSD